MSWFINRILTCGCKYGYKQSKTLCEKKQGCESYLPVLINLKVRRPPRSSHVLQLALLLEPTDRTLSQEEPSDLLDVPVVLRANWDRRDVQVGVNMAERAVLQKELDMDGHPYLGNC